MSRTPYKLHILAVTADEYTLDPFVSAYRTLYVPRPGNHEPDAFKAHMLRDYKTETMTRRSEGRAAMTRPEISEWLKSKATDVLTRYLPGVSEVATVTVFRSSPQTLPLLDGFAHFLSLRLRAGETTAPGSGSESGATETETEMSALERRQFPFLSQKLGVSATDVLDDTGLEEALQRMVDEITGGNA